LITLIDDPRPPPQPGRHRALSMEQAKSHLDLRLQRLTALGREEISEELDKLALEIADYLDILRSRAASRPSSRPSFPRSRRSSRRRAGPSSSSRKARSRTRT